MYGCHTNPHLPAGARLQLKALSCVFGETVPGGVKWEVSEELFFVHFFLTYVLYLNDAEGYIMLI